MRLVEKIITASSALIFGAFIGCLGVAFFAIVTTEPAIITSTIDITFTNGDSEVRKVTYTNIRLNEYGCIQISTEDDIHYKSIVCGVRSFKVNNK